jgi:hypothetical protein
LWLRYYCYERLLQRPASLPPFAAMLATQLISGVWHGVRAGYALFFFGSGLMFQASKVIFRYQRAIPARLTLLRRVVAVVHWFISAVHLSYLAAAFIAVTLPAGRAAFASVHYVGHITMAVRAAHACYHAAHALNKRSYVRRCCACSARCCRRRVGPSAPRRRRAPRRASATEPPRRVERSRKTNIARLSRQQHRARSSCVLHGHSYKRQAGAMRSSGRRGGDAGRQRAGLPCERREDLRQLLHLEQHTGIRVL